MASNDRYIQATADIKVSRSRFPLNKRVMLAAYHGKLIPVGTPIEVLPGDTFKTVISAFTRMSTPIVPIMDDIRQEVDCFFVPKRILWNKTKQFYGEAESFGVATKVYEPTSNSVAQAKSSLTSNAMKCNSIAAAFGLIYDDATGNVPPEINVLPIRAFLACYNEYYRNENYDGPFTWDKDHTGTGSVLAYRYGNAIGGLNNIPSVNKDGDLFTSILPYQVKGNPVALSIGGKVPVVTGTLHSMGDTALEFGGTNASVLRGTYHLTSKAASTGPGAVLAETVSNISDSAVPIKSSNLYADLGSSVGATISDLIYSLAYQDYLARSAKFGTRYREYIFSMFGTTIADASEDIPEYLGRLKFRINVNQVVQTTGFQASASSELGALGAYSNSGKSDKLFTKSFTEPGYLVILTYTKHQRTYSSGVDRVFLKRELLDYYQPPFANIADVPIGSHSIWFDKAVETPLGFQEPWWDYRSLQDRTFGMLNPMIDSLGEIWTLAEKYSAKPTIANAWLEEDRAAISRVLVTGANGPDYLMDFRIEIDATRVMPLYASGKLGAF